MVSVEGVKAYGYLGDESYQPEVMQLCINAAKSWLDNAGVAESENPEYELAVNMLAMHWYDNRGVMAIGAQQGEIFHGLMSIVHQLANSGGGDT